MVKFSTLIKIEYIIINREIICSAHENSSSLAPSLLRQLADRNDSVLVVNGVRRGRSPRLTPP